MEVGGGEGARQREETRGPFCGAGQDVKVMSLSIKSAVLLAWAGRFPGFLREWYHYVVLRDLSLSLLFELRQAEASS